MLQFITAIPLNVERGSGCYIGIRTLAEGLRQLGTQVEMVTPRIVTPIYTATRILFNESLRRRSFKGKATVGFDADGYTIAGKRNAPPHVACIKGVLADAVRFEKGPTRASMALQASLEAKHARRADLVITISRYCAERLEHFYGVKNAVIVPELIDLRAWRDLFRANPAVRKPNKFTVFSVCRFYPRKRLDVLLRAAAQLRRAIPELEIRIAGNGPERGKLRRLCYELHLGSTIKWLGDVSMSTLAREYNAADIFCLPSVQEGFGIVFLEAMAAGKPIVAARAAAVPEVVRNGLLFEPDNPEALVEAILRLYRNPELCESLRSSGLHDVEQFEMHRVAGQFLSQIVKVAPGIEIPEQYGAVDAD